MYVVFTSTVGRWNNNPQMLSMIGPIYTSTRNVSVQYIYAVHANKKITSGRQDGTHRFSIQRLCRHSKQHHTKQIGNMNECTKVSNKAPKLMSTSNLLNYISNDDSTTTANVTYSFAYDKSESTEYFRHNAYTETPNKCP